MIQRDIKNLFAGKLVTMNRGKKSKKPFTTNFFNTKNYGAGISDLASSPSRCTCKSKLDKNFHRCLEQIRWNNECLEAIENTNQLWTTNVRASDSFGEGS